MDVYEGESLLVEYAPLLEVAVAAGFSRSNGELMLHLSEGIGLWHPIVDYVYLVWYFYPLSPWTERFNRYIGLATDTGLRLEMLQRSK